MNSIALDLAQGILSAAYWWPKVAWAGANRTKGYPFHPVARPV